MRLLAFSCATLSGHNSAPCNIVDITNDSYFECGSDSDMSVLSYRFQSSKYAADFADSRLAVFVATTVTCHITAQIAKFFSHLNCSISHLDFRVINPII